MAPNIFGVRLWAQIWKEFLSILRDPRARAILLGPPVVQLLIFSFAATLEVRNATIAIYNRDGGRWSQELVFDLTNASFVGQVLPMRSPESMLEAVEHRQAILAIDIPEDFSRRLSAGQPAPIQAIVDGRRANSGQVALGYVESIAGRLGMTLQPTSTQPTAMTTIRHWFNPNLIYQWFVVPSLAGIMAMLVSLIVTALSIARERELGTFDQLLVSPTTPAEIIIAKVIPALIIGSSLGMFMVAAAIWGFKVPFRGSALLLYGCMLLFILSVVGIGLMISAISSTQQQAILGTFSVAVPMILMSGFATPIENMPDVLQYLAQTIPLKHFLIILQGSFLKAMPTHEILQHAWPMVIIAIVTLSLATGLVRSKLQ